MWKPIVEVVVESNRWNLGGGMVEPEWKTRWKIGRWNTGGTLGGMLGGNLR